MAVKWRGLAGTVAALALVAACGGGAAPESAAMTFMAGFAPQANLPFVGVYVAEAQGYFEDEGIEVAIEHSAGGGEHLQLLAAGAVQVTTQDAAVLLERRADPGLPLVSIALIGQRGQQAYAALAGSGIETPADWAGHTVGYKGTPPPDVFAMMDAAGISADDVELVNVGFDPRALTEGQVDVYPVFKSNEPDTIRNLGHEVVVWEAADFGVPTLGLSYVATEDLIEADPELLRRFVAAAMRGIAYADANRDEAVTIVLTHMGGDADAAHQRFMLDTELADFTSAVTAEQWQGLADVLARYQALPEDVDVEGAFTTALLD